MACGAGSMEAERWTSASAKPAVSTLVKRTAQTRYASRVRMRSVAVGREGTFLQPQRDPAAGVEKLRVGNLLRRKAVARPCGLRFELAADRPGLTAQPQTSAEAASPLAALGVSSAEVVVQIFEPVELMRQLT